ncbi:MAG: phosphatase PAP2 family protein [Chlorobi bacterium]|nr:phosphatase PAP2 family protein [Chlorobiota bacterium]
MKYFLEALKKLNPTDFVVLVFYVFLSLLNLVYYHRVEQWYLLILANVFLIAFIFIVSYYDERLNSKLLRFIHNWYLIPLIFITFKELYMMIKPIRIVDCDQFLISIDRWLLHTDITVELYKIASPLLTEILQISYATFFFLPVILGVELLLNKRTDEFRFATFLIVYGFFLSFYGYFLAPAIGPRFTLHNFYSINADLPGLYLTNFLRDFVNAGESLRPGMLHPEAVVQRDVFPSGHTDMTLIVMYLSYKYKLKSRYFLIPNGLLLIFSTLYLRYHYAIDVIGGIAFMIFTVWSGKHVFNTWQRFRGIKEFSYKNNFKNK